IDNPNLARVHHDLPIRLTERKPQEPPVIPEVMVPGEPVPLPSPFPTFETKELKYDKTQYPEAPPPVDRDVSEAKAKEMGVAQRRGARGLGGDPRRGK